jgi:hypothetical protein
MEIFENQPHSYVTVDIPIRGYRPGYEITAEDIKEKLTNIFI